MKSDREFIDGIYKKAAEYDVCGEQQDNPKRPEPIADKHKALIPSFMKIMARHSMAEATEQEYAGTNKPSSTKWKPAVTLAAVLLIGALSIGMIIKYAELGKKDNSINGQNTQSVRDGGIENDTEGNGITQRGIMSFSIEADEQDALQVLMAEAEKSDSVLVGILNGNYYEGIDSYDESNNLQGGTVPYYEVKVINSYMGDLVKDSIILIKNPEFNAEYGDKSKMLLFLNYIEDNIYELSDEDKSILLYNEESETGLYERYDGISIYEEMLYEGMFFK